MHSAEYWIRHLDLQPHPEGGFFRETYRASLGIAAFGGSRDASTAIYFLLAGDAFSALHRLRSDEVWHFYAGSALLVHSIDPEGNYKVVHLGQNPMQANSSNAWCRRGAGSAALWSSRIHTRWRAAPWRPALSSRISRWRGGPNFSLSIRSTEKLSRSSRASGEAGLKPRAD